jgi:uncharacterized Zn finger protein
MSPPRRKVPAAKKRTPKPRAVKLDVDDLQSLVNQIQALQRRGNWRSSRETTAELSRLRKLLLAALDAEGDDSSEGDADHDDRWDDDDHTDRLDNEAWGSDDPYDDDYSIGGPAGWGNRRAWTNYAAAPPIRVDSGLTTRSRRGAIGETWWSKRFLAAVESTLADGRLSRGRTYARQGQVMELEIGSGLINARVQGSRKTPYNIRVAMPAVESGQWDGIIDALARQAGYAARLLAGELPHEIEDVFAEVGVSLFPSPGSRLSTDCTCPDWANPCKHVAAVCYLVAEAFDRDPFLLLSFRGRGRDDLLLELRQRRGGVANDSVEETPEAAVPDPPLAKCLIGFWKAGPELASVQCLPRASDMPGAVLRQLPRSVIDVRGHDVAEFLEPAYASLADGAEGRAFGDAPRS